MVLFLLAFTLIRSAAPLTDVTAENSGPVADLNASFDQGSIKGEFSIQHKAGYVPLLADKNGKEVTTAQWGDEKPRFYFSFDRHITLPADPATGTVTTDLGFYPGGVWRELIPDWTTMTVTYHGSPDYPVINFTIPNPGIGSDSQGVIMVTFDSTMHREEPDGSDPSDVTETSFAVAPFPGVMRDKALTNVVVPINFMSDAPLFPDPQSEDSYVFKKFNAANGWLEAADSKVFVNRVPQVFVLDHWSNLSQSIMGESWVRETQANDIEFDLRPHDKHRKVNITRSGYPQYVMVYCAGMPNAEGIGKKVLNISGVIRDEQ